MNDETMRGRLQDLSDRKLRTWEDMAREWPSGSTQGINADAFLSLVVEVRKLRDEKNTRDQASAPECPQCAECSPYLKEDETPLERIKRERKDCDGCLELLRRERLKNEDLVARSNAKAGEVWRLIESAPKDGQRVMLWAKEWSGPWAGNYRQGQWGIIPQDCDLVPQPTHWMPLPESPTHDKTKV